MLQEERGDEAEKMASWNSLWKVGVGAALSDTPLFIYFDKQS